MTKDEIQTMVTEFGLALHEQTGGVSNLQYVYADQLLAAHFEQMLADGWRQCAKGQHTSQFCGQLEDAVKAEREACAKRLEMQADYYSKLRKVAKNSSNPDKQETVHSYYTISNELRYEAQVIRARGDDA